MATNMFTKTIFIIFVFAICQVTDTTHIRDQLLTDDNNDDTIDNLDIREKHVPDLDRMQNRNHRLPNTLQPAQRRHSKSKRRMKKRYKCYVCDSSNCQNPSDDLPICSNALQCWKSRVRDAFGKETVSRGCTTVHDHVLFYCNNHGRSSHQKRDTSGRYNIECCFGDFCNNGTFPELPISPDMQDTTHTNSTNSNLLLIVAILGPVITIGMLAFTVLFFLRRTQHKRMIPSRTKHDPDTYYAGDELLRVTQAGDSTLREYLQYSMTSGSGGGLPLLVQRTLSKQITLEELIGKGRYGGVRLGIFNGEKVAVKIFSTRDEESWKRETEIYSEILLRHENILGYFGSDITSRSSITQLWVVTHYYNKGSLYDYLTRTVLTHRDMTIIFLSIANGLVHLHSEIFGTKCKPAVAHRDLKSKNILVRDDGTCVIADFGLAVMQKPNEPFDIGSNPRVGTKRYMAPEILDLSINLNCFESLRRADIYSFGLIMWEVCRRTISNGIAIAEEYKVPYYDVVPSDPGFEDMKKVVVLDNYRPSIPNRWSSESLLSGMAKLMRECWHQNPNVRLPALRIKKTLHKLAADADDVKKNSEGENYV